MVTGLAELLSAFLKLFVAISALGIERLGCRATACSSTRFGKMKGVSEGRPLPHRQLGVRLCFPPKQAKWDEVPC